MSVESTVRKLLPYTSAGLALALLYVGWTFFSRWNDNSAIDRSAAAAKARAEAKIVEMYGSGNLKILNFYVTPGVVKPGQNALVCYGVVNATTVRLDPAVERVYPALNRCFEVAPRRKTRYTLTAEDAVGHTATESFVLEVK